MSGSNPGDTESGKYKSLGLISRLYFFGRMRIAFFHAFVHPKGESIHAETTSKKRASILDARA
ncbi:hypothetical protein SOV_46850 [Sporomusa ovata DSM 2662]|uniref:Uncharacterized protein n=1 Tax=Sporomusa ovata TaxID=2378 RepID=A0A0U1KUY0_9FIRM|nr:hypothetical protein [Sporomusa ovata]EQB27066.1 hypothetical protein SOV_3c09460 [Sporomusa ovata DSM 2662]CQR71171.1 hypothetical protein SpAn4DRAFT_2149 [Sporomusa ovata]